MKELKRFLSYMGKYRYAYWLIFVITLVVSAFVEVTYSYMNKLVFNSVEYDNRSMFIHGVGLCVILVVIRCLFPYLRYFQITVVRKIVFDIKLKLFDKLLGFNMEYYEKHHSGDALKTLNWDANSLKDAYFSHVYWVTGKVTDGVAAIVAMLVYSPFLALVSIGFSLVTVYISVRINKQIKKMDKEIQGRISNLAQRLSDILSGFPVLKMYSGATIVMDNYLDENVVVTNGEKKRVSKAATGEMIAFVMGILANFGTIIVGAVFVSKGMIDYGTVMAVVSLQLSVSSMVQRFGGALTTLNSSLVKAGRVFDFLELQGMEEVTSILENKVCVTEAAVVGTNLVDMNTADKDKMVHTYEYPLVISGLSFGYDDNKAVLENFNMNVSEGEKILLMGESGCGKSTLLKLLLRFYEKTGGEIKLYGKDITQYSLEQLREMITYVPQNNYLFEGTVRENIAFGCNDDKGVSDTEIVRAAELAYAHEFIKEMPQGYDSPITAGGSNLSGGQRQRIAIARAFMKQSPILLLDEPSSALDVHSEKMINLAMKQLMKNRIVIMVTHRTSGLEEFDRVVRMA